MQRPIYSGLRWTTAIADAYRSSRQVVYASQRSLP
jgi:hypothetical protein